MKKITVSKAIGEALHEEMLRDKNVFIMGEDMAVMGNVFAITKGFLEEFGPHFRGGLRRHGRRRGYARPASRGGADV